MKKTVTYLMCAVLLLCVLSACAKTNGNVTPTPTATENVIMTDTPAPTVTVVPTNTPAGMQTQIPATPTIQAP